MIESTRAFKILTEEIGSEKSINLVLIDEILVRFSQLIIDYPNIVEADVNPIVVNSSEALALDARIVLDTGLDLSSKSRYNHLIIKPYPQKYVKKTKLRDGTQIIYRPIRPEDELLILSLFKTFSEETMRFRFFRVIKELSHFNLSRYCNIDYDREMVIVAELKERDERRIIGMVRLVVEPDEESGEIAIVVGDPWQNRGVGTQLFNYIIDVGRDMEMKKLWGEIFSENTRMLHLCYKKGFKIQQQDGESLLACLVLEE